MKSCVPTKREIDIVRAMVEYGTVALAAGALHLSPHTIDAHLDRLREKTGLRHFHQISAWAGSNGWLKRPE